MLLFKIFLYESFGAIAPKSFCFLDYRNGQDWGWQSEKTEAKYPIHDQGMEMAGVKQAYNKSLVKVNDDIKCFIFCPFIYAPYGIAPLQLLRIHNR